MTDFTSLKVDIMELVEFLKKKYPQVREVWADNFHILSSPETLLTALQDRYSDVVEEVFRVFGNNTDNVKSEFIAPLDAKLMDKYRMHVTGQIRALGGNPLSLKNVKIEADQAWSYATMTEYCKMLSREHQAAVFVYPASKIEKNTFKHGEYCKFPFRVAAELSTHKLRFELASLYSRETSDDESGESITEFELFFSDEQIPQKWVKVAHKSIIVEGYLYSVTVDDKTISILSQFKLDAGDSYVGTGMVFWVNPQEKGGIRGLKKDTVCWLMHVEPEYTDQTLSQELIDKCRGKGVEWFMKSVVAPFPMIRDYMHYWGTQFFHIRTDFPDNRIVIGPPGTTKSKIVEKLACITQDHVISAEASTIKGLLPSFGNGTPRPGALFSSRFRVLVNELFTLTDNLPPPERSVTYSKLKSAFEGATVDFSTGFGTITGRMKCDFIAVSNPAKKKEGYHDTIMRMYEDYDPAFMDRVLWYFVPDSQVELVQENVGWIEPLLKNSNKDFAKIDYTGYLDIKDLRTIVRFLQNCNLQIPKQLQNLMKEVKDDLQKEFFPPGVCSRLMHFLTNVSGGYCFIRHLNAGNIPADNTYYLNNEDVLYARDLMVQIFMTYRGHSTGRTRVLSEKELAIMDQLFKSFDSENKYARKVFIADLRKASKLGDSFDRILDDLVNSGMVIRDAEYVMKLPELSHESKKVFNRIQDGTSFFSGEEGRIASYLSKLGLCGWTQEKGYYSLWPKNQEFMSTYDRLVSKLKLIGVLGQKQALEEFSSEAVGQVINNGLVIVQDNGDLTWAGQKEAQVSEVVMTDLTDRACAKVTKEFIVAQDCAPYEQDVIDAVKKQGFTEDQIERTLEMMKHRGDIMRLPNSRIQIL